MPCGMSCAAGQQQWPQPQPAWRQGQQPMLQCALCWCSQVLASGHVRQGRLSNGIWQVRCSKCICNLQYVHLPVGYWDGTHLKSRTWVCTYAKTMRAALLVQVLMLTAKDGERSYPLEGDLLNYGISKTRNTMCLGGAKKEAFMYECGRTPRFFVKWKKILSVKRVCLVCFHLWKRTFGWGQNTYFVFCVYKRHLRKNHKKLIIVISYGWSCELGSGGWRSEVVFALYTFSVLFSNHILSI